MEETHRYETIILSIPVLNSHKRTVGTKVKKKKCMRHFSKISYVVSYRIGMNEDEQMMTEFLFYEIILLYIIVFKNHQYYTI